MQVLSREKYNSNSFQESHLPASALNLPFLSKRQIELINEWVKRKVQYQFQIDGQKIEIKAITTPEASQANTKRLTYRLETNEAKLKIKIEERLFYNILSWKNEVRLDNLELNDTAILVEFFFTGLLNKFEKTFSNTANILFQATQEKEVSPQSVTISLTLNGKPDLYYIWLESRENDLDYWLDIVKSLPISANTPTPIDHLKIIPLNLLLGIVEFELSQISTLERGDIILLEGLKEDHFQISASLNMTWPAIRTNNNIQLIGSALSKPIVISSVNKEVDSVSVEMKENSPFDEIPVVLAFEVGRKDVSVQDLKAFSEGTIVQFPDVDQTNIKILANGAKIGEGSLVQVGDSIGVKINRIFKND